MFTVSSTFPIYLLEYRIFVSSANNTHLSWPDTLTISFMNKMGSKTDPCATCHNWEGNIFSKIWLWTILTKVVESSKPYCFTIVENVNLRSLLK